MKTILKNALVSILALILFSCAEDPKYYPRVGKFKMIQNMYATTSELIQLNSFATTEVWAGKCVSESDPTKQWGAALILNPRTKEVKILGSTETAELHYLNKTESEILVEVRTTRLTSVQIFSLRSQKTLVSNSTSGSETNPPKVYGIRRSNSTGGIPILVTQEFWAEEVPATCYYSHNKTSRSNELNQEAQEDLDQILLAS